MKHSSAAVFSHVVKAQNVLTQMALRIKSHHSLEMYPQGNMNCCQRGNSSHHWKPIWTVNVMCDYHEAPIIITGSVTVKPSSISMKLENYPGLICPWAIKG